MNRRKLGPPPSWIPAAEAPREVENSEAADPLQNIFSASRSARLGDSDDDALVQTYTARRESVSPNTITNEITALLHDEKRKRSPFTEVILAPGSNADVRDTRDTRLIILAPAHTHSGGTSDSIARKKSSAFLSHYGVGPRRYRNTLVFLAPEAGKLAELSEDIRCMLAWKSIVDSPGGLEPRFVDRARSHAASYSDRKRDMLREAFGWLLAPTQSEPGAPIEWRELRLQSGYNSLAESAAHTLVNANLVRIDDLGLAEDIDAARTWLGDSISAAQLADEFARQLYLPRLIDESVLHSALQTALAAGIRGRNALTGPKKLYTAQLRLDSNDLARIAPQLLQQLNTLVSPVDLKLTLQIDALVPDAARTQLESIISESGRKTGI